MIESPLPGIIFLHWLCQFVLHSGRGHASFRTRLHTMCISEARPGRKTRQGAETDETLFCKPPICEGSVSYVGIVPTTSEKDEVFSGKTQNSPHSWMCEINFKLHSERTRSSRRKSNNQLLSMVSSYRVWVHVIHSAEDALFWI